MGYTFKSSESYELPEKNYSFEETPEEEETVDLGAFLKDKSPKGLLIKGAILFLVFFLIFGYGISLLLVATGAEASAWPHRIIINLCRSPIWLMLDIILSLVLASAFTYALKGKLPEPEQNFEMSGKNTYGSAREAEDADMKGAVNFYPIDRPAGFVLGRRKRTDTMEVKEDTGRFKPEVSVCVDKWINKNRNFAVFGPSGTGKSFSMVIPNVLTKISDGESFFVTDPSGEIYEHTGQIARDHGYKVCTLNLIDFAASSGWNPFDIFEGATASEIHDRVSNLTHTIMTNTKDEDAKTDAFFDQNEEMLLTALVLYVAVSPHFTGEPHERHMGTVYDLLTKLAAQEGILEEFANLPESDPAKGPWKLFQGSGKLKTNFITGLAAKLNLFQDDMLKEVMSHSEIDLREAGRSKCAYYIVTPVDNNKMSFILSLFFSCAFEQLMQEGARNQGNKLKVPVSFILDEFKAIGKINTFGDKIANVRKYRISIMIIFQDIQQLEQAYPGSYRSILSNCATWVVLGVNNTETAEELSRKIGTSTARTRSTSKQMMEKQFVSPVNSAISQSESESGRNFLNPDEIERYFDDMGDYNRKVMILANTKNVYLADAYGWPNHYLAEFVPAEADRQKANDFIPDWQKNGELTMDKKRSFLDLSAQIEYAGKADSTELRRKTIMQGDSPKKAASRMAAEKKPESKPEDISSDAPAETNAKTEAHKKGIILDTSEKSSHLMTLGEEKKITSFGLDLFGDESKKKGGKKK